MRYLCIDTSAGTAIAVVDSQAATPVRARAQTPDTRYHAEQLTPLLREVLQQADLPLDLASAGIETIAVGTGPAPYTGLRAGLITARVLARTVNVPIWGVTSLDILARQALDLVADNTEVLVVTDARRKEVYAASYRASGPDDVRVISGPAVGPAADFASSGSTSGSSYPGRVLAGQGCLIYPDILPLDPGLPTEIDPAVLARIVAARQLRVSQGEEIFRGTEPQYLRRPDVHPGGSPKSVLDRRG